MAWTRPGGPVLVQIENMDESEAMDPNYQYQSLMGQLRMGYATFFKMENYTAHLFSYSFSNISSFFNDMGILEVFDPT